MKKITCGWLLISILMFIINYSPFTMHQLNASQIYLDITQPGIKKLTIATEGFDKTPKIFETIKNNLEFTDYFKIYGPFPYREEKFDPSLWKATDVEIVIRSDIQGKIIIKVFTVTSDLPIFVREYAPKDDENNGNLISADIYRLLTGKEPPFFNRIVFLKKFKGSTGIFISNWNGSHITDTGIRREIISRAVLKNNKVFFSSLHHKFWHIEVFDLSSKKSREIIKSKALLQMGDVIDDYRFVYLQNDGDISQIKTYEPSGNGKTISTSRWIESSPRIFGNKLFFVSNRAGSPQIYEIQDSVSIRRITFQGRYNTEPTISPDGSKIAFSSLVGNFQINILDFISNSQSQITDKGNNEQPSFCPDGHFLTIMSDRRGKKEVYLISIDGMVQKPITEGYLPYCTR